MCFCPRFRLASRQICPIWVCWVQGKHRQARLLHGKFNKWPESDRKRPTTDINGSIGGLVTFCVTFNSSVCRHLRSDSGHLLNLPCRRRACRCPTGSDRISCSTVTCTRSRSAGACDVWSRLVFLSMLSSNRAIRLSTSESIRRLSYSLIHNPKSTSFTCGDKLQSLYQP